MSAIPFAVRNASWRRVMGSDVSYRVPRFQRDYDWGPEEWDDLWHDILGVLDPDGEPAHYLGYLVLRTEDARRFEIIDGQQRLTTLSILVLAGLRQLQDRIEAGKEVEATRQRRDGLRAAYIGYLDPVTLVPQSKLTLNRHDDRYYQTYLVPLTKKLPMRGFRASEHRLRKAFAWFSDRLRDTTKSASDPGREIAALIERLSDRLFFTVIEVSDQVNAYRVFETLNARGLQLSATDLLKNYLFALLDRRQHENELQALEDRWEGLIGRLGSRAFPQFLRAHWISRRRLVRKSDLFKAIRREISDREQAFSLLRNMEEDADAWLALTAPDAGNGFLSEEEARAARQLRVFGVRQPLPLLLAARRKLDTDAFRSLLRAIVVLSFRYNVIGNLHTGDQERAYSQEAHRIETGEHATLGQILSGLRSIYPNDEQFRVSFARKRLRVRKAANRMIARYLLSRLEQQIHGVSVDPDGPEVSLEHICPERPEEGWDAFSDAELTFLTARLGNMTLLERSRNRKLGNASWKVKQEAFRKSCRPATREIAGYDSWTPERIEARQRAMAKAATAVWRISQLS